METKILRFEITDKCNQRCKMCWSTNWKHNDMNWEDMKKVIIDYSNNFPNGTIVLTSREPLLSPLFENALLLAKELGLKMKLLTNGCLLNDENCKLIINSTIDFISISIHGGEKYHNMIVNSNNSYKNTIDGIKKICSYKKMYGKDLDIRITTVVNNNSLNNIEEIVNLCSNYNINLRIQHMMWFDKMTKEEHKKTIKEKFNYDDDIIDGFLGKVDINPNYVIQTINKAKKICDNKNVDLQVYPDLSEKEIVDWYLARKINISNECYCDHVKESIRMRANGDITLCQYIDRYYGNATKDDFKKILSSKEYKCVSEKLINGNLFPICYHCCHLRKKNNKEILNNSKI